MKHKKITIDSIEGANASLTTYILDNSYRLEEGIITWPELFANWVKAAL